MKLLFSFLCDCTCDPGGYAFDRTPATEGSTPAPDRLTIFYSGTLQTFSQFLVKAQPPCKQAGVMNRITSFCCSSLYCARRIRSAWFHHLQVVVHLDIETRNEFWVPLP